jgi:FkbM family methyltransferase
MFHDLLTKAGKPLGTPVIDVGVNVGAFTMFASSLGCRVFGFEMQPFLANLVDMSLRISGYRFRSHVKNSAVWYLSGKNFSFTPYKGNFGGTAVKENEKEGTFKISSIRIDEYLTSANKTHEEFFFMKMDIEGSEPNALLGMNSIIRRGQVRHIVIEMREAALLSVFYTLGYICNIFTDGPDCLWPNLQPQCFFPTYENVEQFFGSKRRKKFEYFEFHCELHNTSSVKPYEPSQRYTNVSLVRYKDDVFEVHGNTIKSAVGVSVESVKDIPVISYNDIFAFDFVRD